MDRSWGSRSPGPRCRPEGQEHVRKLQLYSLYVLASEYGRGVGRELLETVLGSEPAMLWVANQNPRAIAFYRKHGFELDGMQMPDPGVPTLTDVRMVR